MVSNVKYYRPQDPAEAAEFDAFMRMLPELRHTHGGKNVAICGGEVVAVGDFLNLVEQRARLLTQGRAVYYAWIEPPEGYIAFSGLFEVREGVA